MPPKKEVSGNEDVLFLISCLLHTESINFEEVAVMNGIAGTPSLKPHAYAQRKFKKLVDASGKFKIEAGKVVLKDVLESNGGGDNDDNEASASASAVTPPADDDSAVTTPKKRGRPAKASTTPKSNKKTKSTEKATSDDEA